MMGIDLRARNILPTRTGAFEKADKSGKRFGFGKGKAAIGGRFAIGDDHNHPIAVEFGRIIVAHMGEIGLRRIPKREGHAIATGLISFGQPCNHDALSGLALP
ncbi:class II glutamine amidotransferase domain-containing protein [Paracoccus cavernae]|uniref:hypothetical protein n=1 Tax=Paracoccus cavernae TaxID=1571207 RepID=UPI0036418CF0